MTIKSITQEKNILVKAISLLVYAAYLCGVVILSLHLFSVMIIMGWPIGQAFIALSCGLIIGIHVTHSDPFSKIVIIKRKNQE